LDVSDGETQANRLEWKECADATHSLGIWKLGQPGHMHRLQLVVPERPVMLASEDETRLEEWHWLLQDVGKGTRVSEIQAGWVEKKNSSSDRWSSRFLVLLSTHELLILPREVGAQPKDVINLANLRKVEKVSEFEEDGYDYAFAIEENTADGDRHVFCVDVEEPRDAWIKHLREIGVDHSEQVVDHEEAVRSTSYLKSDGGGKDTSHGVAAVRAIAQTGGGANKVQ